MGYGSRHFKRKSLRAKKNGFHKLFVSMVLKPQKRSKSSGVVAAHLLKNVAPAPKLVKFNNQGPFLTRGLLEDPAPYAPKPPGALFDQPFVEPPFKPENHQGPFLSRGRALASKTTRGPFDQVPLGGPPRKPQNHQRPFLTRGLPKPQDHQVPFLTRRLLPCSINRPNLSKNRPNLSSPRAPAQAPPVPNLSYRQAQT